MYEDRNGQCIRTGLQRFQDYASRSDRKTSELIREAMEEFRRRHIERQTSLRNRNPVSVGGPIAPIYPEDDLPGEMLEDARD